MGFSIFVIKGIAAIASQGVGLRAIYHSIQGNIQSMKVLLGFAIANFLLRGATFFQSVINHDESLYLIIADQILQGIPPYVDIWDHKPPGIYFLFALGLTLFGDSILAIRLLTLIAVTITCYLLYRISLSIFPQSGQRIGILAGLLYAVFSLTNGGLAANTEVFFIPFVVGSFYWFFRHANYYKNSALTWIGIGILMGLAAQIKYLVVFDFLALVIFAFLQRDRKLFFTFRNVILLGLGSSIIFTIVAFYFWQQGIFSEYLSATLLANATYIQTDNLTLSGIIDPLITQILRYFLFWVCLLFCVTEARLSYQKTDSSFAIFHLMIWLVCILPAPFISQRLYDHYFLQLLPPLCLITAYAIDHHLNFKSKYPKQLFFIILGSISGIYFLFDSAIATLQYSYYRLIKQENYWGDRTALIAQEISQIKQAGESIYVYNDQPILYYLLKAKPPTPFLFLSHFQDNLTQTSPLQEFNQIINLQPNYIIINTNPNDNDRYKVAEIEQKLAQTLAQNYQLRTSISGVHIYQRL